MTASLEGLLPVSLAFRILDHISPHGTRSAFQACWISQHSRAYRIGCLVADPRSPFSTEFDPLD